MFIHPADPINNQYERRNDEPFDNRKENGEKRQDNTAQKQEAIHDYVLPKLDFPSKAQLINNS